MAAPRWQGGPERVSLQERSFERPIPRLLHRLDLGNGGPGAADAGHEAWAAYARAVGWELRVWDQAAAAIILPPENRRVLARLRAEASWVAAAQLLATSILVREGGVFLGRHAVPPTNGGQPVDLGDHVPMRGLVTVAAPFSRLLRGSSTWVVWDLLMACPNHPVLRHLEQVMPGNVSQYLASHPMSPSFATGSVLLSQILGGPFTTMPAHSARAIGILPAVDLDR